MWQNRKSKSKKVERQELEVEQEDDVEMFLGNIEIESCEQNDGEKPQLDTTFTVENVNKQRTPA